MTSFALEIIQMTVVVGNRNEITLHCEHYSFLLSTLKAIYNWRSVCSHSILTILNSQEPFILLLHREGLRNILMCLHHSDAEDTVL